MNFQRLHQIRFLLVRLCVLVCMHSYQKGKVERHLQRFDLHCRLSSLMQFLGSGFSADFHYSL